MRIGIDISQIAYEGTGVSEYLKNLVSALLRNDPENEYVLFASVFRKDIKNLATELKKDHKNVTLVTVRIPPTVLDILWNRMHIFPIENFIGKVDLFISSDWTQPPVKRAKNVTILYDLIIYKYPEETAAKIIATQKRKLHWSQKECDLFLCISEATKKDAMEVLGISEKKLAVVYPGETI